MTKTLLVHLRSGSMMNMDSNLAVKLMSAALDQGYNVRFFGYGEGITVIKEGQDPKRFPNVGKELIQLAERGATIVVCETCCAARGIHRGEEVKGSKIGSLTNDFSKFVAEADRIVTLAR
ncbi:MAG TPA: DsrE family protein [Methanomassiliicoccales archaeon]|nr:DsrE family protein [Methanomassiliicoccales archaeon]